MLLVLIFVLMISMALGCQSKDTKPKEQDLVKVKSSIGNSNKKVIMFVVDSLMSQAIDQGIKDNELSAIKYLIEHGQYSKDVVSSFPTMSVTIDSSLLTGAYPDAHHVPGLTWYSTKDKKIINYGTGPMEIFRHGVNPVLVDALVHLNGSHMNEKLPTLFEDLAQSGLKSGSINGLIYRGNVDHTLIIPPWIHGPTVLPKEITVKGPDYLALGSLSNPLKELKEMPDGLMNRMGLNNRFSVATVNYLIKKNKLPDFLYVYLPDLDQEIHKKGPAKLESIKKLDNQIQSILESFGSPAEALNKAIFIIVGDSGMTQLLPEEENPVIDLPAFFKNYRVFRHGESITEQTDIVLAVNETMAYVYSLKEHRLQDIALLLRSDPRIDIIAWKEKNNWINVLQGGTSKELRFKTDGKLTDLYKQKWTIEQQAEVLDLKINNQQRTLAYGQYPDVLRRLSGALHSHPGQYLIVTAKPGYELADKSSPTHEGGGGHGSLGKTESLIPLIISGTNEKPQYLRIIDLKPFLLKLLTK